MLPSTVARVPEHTADHVNQQVRRQTEQNVIRVANQGAPGIQRRLIELDREWDIERALETNASLAVLAGVALGTFVDRRFFALPAIVGGFLLQHALQGWCPPIPILRRLGFRTSTEIDHERYALKGLRGDFQKVQPAGDNAGMAEQMLVAAQR